jgi:hypothetical protein
MYYTAQTVSGHNGRYCLAVATATNPAGPFTPRSTAGPFLCDDGNLGAIDPYPFIDPSGRAWLYYKTYDDKAGDDHAPGASALWVVELNAGNLLAHGAPRLVLHQNALSTVNETVENPQMVATGGRYFLFFSRGNWYSAGYRTGYALCAGPAGPCSEATSSLLTSYGNVWGPGGGSAFADANGNWWLGYQGWNAPCQNYSGSSCARRLFVARLELSTCGNGFPRAVVAGFSTNTGNGFWITFADGAVSSHGDAVHRGDVRCLPLRGPMVGGAAAPSTSGYWLVASDGGIFSFGTAKFYGSMGGKPLNQPVFSMAATKSGKGYWSVARDGGIFSFGDAKFFGSMGGKRLNQPITGITNTPTGRGYRMIARDGGIFSFGDAPFYGSLPGLNIRVNDVVAAASTPTNRGYWIARANGSVYAFGDAKFLGSYQVTSAWDPVVGIFSNPVAQGYRLVTATGKTVPFGNAPG